LGITISLQTSKLRQLLKHAENFDSNVLHVYILAAPDLLGAKSVFPLVQTHGDVVKRALALKRLSHEWGSLIGGRTTHPTTVVPGGYSKVPTEKGLSELKEKLLKALPDLDATVETLLSLSDKIPDFQRPTEYMALAKDDGYAIYDGQVQTLLPDGTKSRYSVSEYLSITNEYVSQWSTAKYCKNKLDSYMVGALARINNNYEHLCPEAKMVAEKFGLNAFTTNPYMNTIAQLVELVNDVYGAITLIDEIIMAGVKPEALIPPSRYASGTGAVEVPRGILFHQYSYDQDGICTGGDYVIPTNQNHANIQYDFEKLVPELLEQDKSEAEMELALEMLVRAYDPCISCSAHYLDVKFVK